MKIEQIVAKFRLKDATLRDGAVGQKMSDECIQRFVDSDPSGHGKYLTWMFYQAGGGKARLDRSTTQWLSGEHGEPSLREMVKFHWTTARVKGFKDDITGEVFNPVSKEEAERLWEEAEPQLRDDFIYGDEDHYANGGFGFFQNWKDSSGVYDHIVDLVRRFHQHRQSLRARGAKLDLTIENYPHTSDLRAALKDVIAVELLARLDHDVVFDNQCLLVVCPYTIGSSIKYGLNKWCTANETEMMRALAGERNRWIEHAANSALYYCRFKDIHGIGDSSSVAVQVDLNDLKMPLFMTGDVDAGGALTESGKMKCAVNSVMHAKYWDAEDKNHTLNDYLKLLSDNPVVTLDHLASFKNAVDAIARHFKNFNRKRIVTEWCS